MTAEEARDRARDEYQSDDIEIDENARVILLDEPGPYEGDAWVQAWVFVRADERVDGAPGSPNAIVSEALQQTERRNR